MVLRCKKTKSSLFTANKTYNVLRCVVDYNRVKDGVQYEVITDLGSKIIIKLSSFLGEFCEVKHVEKTS